MSEFKLPGIVFQFVDDTFNQSRLTLAILADKSHLLATLDGKVDLVEHQMVAIALADVLTKERDLAGMRSRREFQVNGRRVFVVNLNTLNLVKRLYTALHLHSLSGLIAETLNKLLRIGNGLLLVFESAHLLFPAFFAQFHKLGVRHLVVVDVSARNFNGSVGNTVEEGTVVRNQQHRASVLFQEVLEPLNRLNVEVVGRLVEQKHIGLTQQDFSQLDTHTPTARELARLPVEIVTFETQTQKRLLNIALVRVNAENVELFVGMGQVIDKLVVVVTLVIGASGQLLPHLVDFVL